MAGVGSSYLKTKVYSSSAYKIRYRYAIRKNSGQKHLKVKAGEDFGESAEV